MTEPDGHSELAGQDGLSIRITKLPKLIVRVRFPVARSTVARSTTKPQLTPLSFGSALGSHPQPRTCN